MECMEALARTVVLQISGKLLSISSMLVLAALWVPFGCPFGAHVLEGSITAAVLGP